MPQSAYNLQTTGQATLQPVRPISEFWDENFDGFRLVNNKVAAVKCGVLRTEAPPGTSYFRLMQAHFSGEVESAGKHNYGIDVLDESGRRLHGARVQQGWPWGRWPEKDDSAIEVLFGSKLAEFGIYANYDPNKVEYGPYWFRVQGLNSDVFYGAGLPGNRHVQGSLIFQRLRKEPEEPVPPPETLQEALYRLANASGVEVPYTPDFALWKVIGLHGGFPTSPEFRFEHEGVEYVGQRAQVKGSDRVYYCVAEKWDVVNSHTLPPAA